MKRLFLIMLFAGFSNLVYSQFTDNNAIYYTSDLLVGSYVGLDLDLNYVYKEKYSIKIGYIVVRRTPASKPEDYEIGLLSFLFLGLTNPTDRIQNYQIGIGKVYNLSNKYLRLNFSLGIGYSKIREASNWRRTGGNFIADNYIWDYQYRNEISLIINPRIEFPFTRIYGLSVSPVLLINQNSTFIGIGFGHMIGLLRKKSK